MTDIDGDTGAVGGGCLEDYEIIKPIGKGKFAIVYRAQRKSDSELVALKKIQISSMDPKARSKTLKEVRLLQSLNHPNVIKYLDSFLTDSELIIVFEWAAAGDLKRQIRKALTRNTYFDERVCWKYFSQIAEAILHMHSQRVLHRDLKPANIFLTLNGTVKVGDLGLGRSLSEHTMEAHSKVGTPLYMSPEVLRGSGYDWKSDVWSLGCLLYELACLKSPFKSVGLNLYSLFQKISKGDYKELPGQYSDELKRLAYAMISTEPGDRPDLETVCEVARTMKERTRNDKPKNIPRPPDVVEAVKEGEDEGPKVEEGKLEEQVEKSVEKEEEKDGQVTPRIETKKTLTPAPVKEPRSTPKLNVDNRGDDSDESDLAGAEPVKQLFGGGGNTSERPVSRSAGRRTGRMEAREPEAAPGEFKNPEEDDVVSIPTRQPEQAKPRTTTSITSSHLLHTTMESVHYKLALLPERCSKKIGFHHFSHASSGSAHTQFLDFLILAEFLMKILGRSISINQDDSPLQLSKQMLNSLSGLLDVKLLSSVRVNNLVKGWGEEVVGVLDGLVDRCLGGGYVFKGVRREDVKEVRGGEEDDVEEEEVEDEVEVEVEEESVEKWRDVEEFKSEGRDMLNSEVDGREWRIEMERVGPRLKTKGTDAGWRGRVDIMKGLEIETISGLERVAVRVGEERERLVEGERSISNLKAFERIGGEWQEIKKEEEDVKSLRDKLEELCRERSEVLEEVVEEGKSVKVKMESRAEGMSDTGKLVEIRKGMKALESENRNMELMLGVAAATNMSSYVIVNNRSREGDNDDGSSLAGSLSLGSYGGSLENSVDAVGGQDEGSLESS
ncbi:hypothetical protein TrLO_g9555 [Triparma laevis f. longispina]|uniref:non-specific serine/threonine protein kinase n=1 Tax=Triparma laevis f. longispina TaxID=1714387 RepID=A0A9W6Z9Z9_9STRA|nr:hypothetical protein TrLO_g9555 [Triparma laevis f. longispina]